MVFGATRRRVLGWLLGHPDETYYLRQIARHTGAAVGAVQRELALLTAAGLVLVTNNTAEFRRVKGLKIENWAPVAGRRR